MGEFKSGGCLRIATQSVSRRLSPSVVAYASGPLFASFQPASPLGFSPFMKHILMSFSRIIAVMIGALLLHAHAGENQKTQHDQRRLLWPDGAPEAVGDAVTDQPSLTVHLPDPDKATGTGIVVNPGGGYHILASDHEGLQVARELNRHGIAAFVLRYRLQPTYEPSVALLDGKRAMRYVRYHAKKFGIAPDRIGMLGFSAGGNLAAATGTAFDAGDLDHADPVERNSSRPDFLVPVYPAIDYQLFAESRGDREKYGSLQKLVTAETPPAFLVHTHEDNLSANHSVVFYRALLEHGIQAELHVFGKGPHGTGLAPGDPDLGQWPHLLVNWLRRNRLLTSDPAYAIKGHVELEGKPLFWGSATFTPEDPNQPSAVAHMGWKSEGKFELKQDSGPCLGKHHVKVIVQATEFPNPKSGDYSMTDIETYQTTIDITEANCQDLVIKVGDGVSS